MNARKNNLSRKPNLSIERLEDRQMMAGDVAVSNANGFLTISEAPNQPGGANSVQVSQLPSGRIRVQGFANLAGDVTLVNGLAQQDFDVSGTGILVMNLGDGNDIAKVGGIAPFNRFSEIKINTTAQGAAADADVDFVSLDLARTTAGIKIDTGAGGDTVRLANTTAGGRIEINTGDGAAYVDIRNVTTSGPMDITTGNGVDAISIFGSTIGDGAGVDDLIISTGAGVDTVKMNVGEINMTQVRGSLRLNTYAASENDVDSVDMQNVTVDQNITAFFGDGADNLIMVNVYANADIILSGDAGNDTFTLGSVRSGDDFTVHMGEGGDDLQMDYVVAADRMDLNGGVGFDRVRHSNVTAREQAFSLWETLNGRGGVSGISGIRG